MPVIKRPCLQCKDKHVKCDEGQPRCHRCIVKNLPCARPAKKTVFRNSSSGPLNNQTWVNSEVREFAISPRSHFDDHSGTSPRFTADHNEPSSHTHREPPPFNTNIRNNHPIYPSTNTPQSSGNSPSYPSSPWQQGAGRSPTTDQQSVSSVYSTSHDQPSPYDPPHDQSRDQIPSPRGYQTYSSVETTRFPLQDPQEACLLRYFVEELSHWLDLCDERRHFQLVVPIRARHHPPLLYAIFALSARHLSRLPKYKTPQGILYQGQLLPKLTTHDAVEYTLKCIPALRDFHTIQDDEKLESIIATAVILRQLEEIDDEEDSSSSEQDEQERNRHGKERPATSKPQVNFLAIIDAVLRSPPSRTLFGRRSLIQAAYWMAVRQELYHSFTKRHPPKMVLDAEYGLGASKANKIVLHTAQVAKWRWADGSEQEWLRLQKQGESLEEEALREYQPFYVRPADRSNGEIFPIIWYSSALEVTSMQLCIIAKMVLMAENPFLGGNLSSTRAQWRDIENQVRQMILDLCGISLCHPGCPPALVHAAFGMELYGDFFTDEYERKALRGVVDKFRDARAWPVQNLSRIFE